MKKLIILVFACVFLFSGMAYADLIASYSFSGNANDESGYGNDGTVYDATLTTDRYGNENSAYYFDGVNDYIRITDSNSLDLTDSFTISLSFLQDSETSGSLRLVDKITAGYGDGYLLDTHPGQDVRLLVDSHTYYNDTNFANDVWHDLTAIFDRGNYALYMDGVLLTSGYDASWQPAPVNSLDLFLGAAQYGGSPYGNYFHGKMDNIKIYNSAVPEPATMLLLGFGLVGLAGFRRKKI